MGWSPLWRLQQLRQTKTAAEVTKELHNASELCVSIAHVGHKPPHNRLRTKFDRNRVQNQLLLLFHFCGGGDASSLNAQRKVSLFPCRGAAAALRLVGCCCCCSGAGHEPTELDRVQKSTLPLRLFARGVLGINPGRICGVDDRPPLSWAACCRYRRRFGRLRHRLATAAEEGGNNCKWHFYNYSIDACKAKNDGYERLTSFPEQILCRSLARSLSSPP